MAQQAESTGLWDRFKGALLSIGENFATTYAAMAVPIAKAAEPPAVQAKPAVSDWPQFIQQLDLTKAEDIKKLQTRLHAEGFYGENSDPQKVIDGKLGNETSNAMLRLHSDMKNNPTKYGDADNGMRQNFITNLQNEIREITSKEDWAKNPDNIKAIQALANASGLKGSEGAALKIDGVIGPKTQEVLKKIGIDAPATPRTAAAAAENNSSAPDRNTIPVTLDEATRRELINKVDKILKESAGKDSLDINQVKELQDSLNRLGITDGKGNPLKVDGIAGPATGNAITTFLNKYENELSGNNLQAPGQDNPSQETPASDANSNGQPRTYNASDRYANMPDASMEDEDRRARAARGQNGPTPQELDEIERRNGLHPEPKASPDQPTPTNPGQSLPWLQNNSAP
jgi:hypothetical protein